MPKSPIPKKKSRFKRKKRGKPKKLSAIELAERRQAVMTLRLKGLSYKSIAEQVGVGCMTVKRDLDQVRQDNIQQVSEFNRDVALGRAIASYNEIEREAWIQYHLTKSGTSQKAQFLNMVRVANNDRVRLLTEVGLVSRAAARVEHKIETDGVLAGWTQDAKQLVAMAIIRAQMDGTERDRGNGKGSILELPPHLVTDQVEESSEPETEKPVAAEGGNGVS